MELNQKVQYGADVALLNGDCISELRNLKPESVDLALTDPPYNLGLFMKDRATNLAQMRDNYFGAAGWDNAEAHEWELLMDSFFKHLVRSLKRGANVVIFMSILKVETVVRIANQYDLYYKTTGIWHKTNPMPRNMNIHFINSTEAWIHFTYKSRRGTFNNKGKARHDFLETSVTPQSERRHGKHPTQKPTAVMNELVDLLSNPGDLVLDPFMGSGSTGVSAVQKQRRFIGIELDPTYFALANSRISEANQLCLLKP